MGGHNKGNFLNPSNLIPAVLTGGLSYGISSTKRAMQPPALPDQPPPPPPPAVTFGEDPAQTAADRQKKLSAMKFGFASTITNKSGALGSLFAPVASSAGPALKQKTGQ